MKDSKDSTEQKRWEDATRTHAYHKHQLKLLAKLRQAPTSIMLVQRHNAIIEKLEKEFLTLKDSK